METAITPSCLAKVRRAKEHLVYLEDIIGRYVTSKPYTVSERIEGKKKKKVFRLSFTSSPANTDIPIVVADIIYNLHTSLEHLMASIVPKRARDKVMFPIFFQGIWETSSPRDNPQRVKARERWASDTKLIPDEAVAILKSLQPPDNGGDEDKFDLLILVKSLSNRDRHEKLPVLNAGLRGMAIQWETPDGTTQRRLAPNTDPSRFFGDQTVIPVPDDAMNVKVEGGPVIAIHVGKEFGGRQPFAEIPSRLYFAAEMIEKKIIPALTPFIRADYP